MNKLPDLSKYSLEELQQFRKDVDKAIAKAEAQKLKDARAALEKVAAEHGVTLEEITGRAASKRQVGKPLPPKYQHPENPNVTWSGRGRQPRWIKEMLKSGNDLAEYEIKS